MSLSFRHAWLSIALVFATVALAQSGGGTVKGSLKVNGKSIALKHALAVTGADAFDETKRVTYIYLTEKPISAEQVSGAASARDLSQFVSAGIRLQPTESGGDLAIFHPALGDFRITTGAGFGYKPTSSGPERYAGTLQSFGADRGEDEETFGHKIRYDLSFDVSVSHSYPVKEKRVLSAKAKKLGAGGGAPGKAWLEDCAKAANLPKTKEEMKKRLADEGALPTQADLDEMSKERGKKVTMDDAVEFLFELVQLGSSFAPKNCKVLGGSYDPDLAIIQVEADVFEDRSRTDVTLEKKNGTWEVIDTGTWTSAPKK
jgi:hypothetical protein